MQHFWLELAIFYSKLLSATNQQLFLLDWKWYQPSNHIASLYELLVSQLAQRRCDNVVVDVVTLWHGRKWVVPTSVSDIVTTSLSNFVKRLLQRRHNIKHWITRPFYHGLFWFLFLHRNVKVTKVLSSIKHASFLFKKALYL